MPRRGSWVNESHLARCPLHLAYRDDEIVCRSHMPGASVAKHVYSDPQEAAVQIRVFCNGCFERCEHYRAWKHFMWEDDEE